MGYVVGRFKRIYHAKTLEELRAIEESIRRRNSIMAAAGALVFAVGVAILYLFT
jgi:hypothetical protein